MVKLHYYFFFLWKEWKKQLPISSNVSKKVWTNPANSSQIKVYNCRQQWKWLYILPLSNHPTIQIFTYFNSQVSTTPQNNNFFLWMKCSNPKRLGFGSNTHFILVLRSSPTTITRHEIFLKITAAGQTITSVLTVGVVVCQLAYT